MSSLKSSENIKRKRVGQTDLFQMMNSRKFIATLNKLKMEAKARIKHKQGNKFDKTTTTMYIRTRAVPKCSIIIVKVSQTERYSFEILQA